MSDVPTHLGGYDAQRRRLVLGASLSGACGLLVPTRVLAIDPVTLTVVAISLANMVVGWMKESGELEKRTAAMETQLNAIVGALSVLANTQAELSRGLAKIGAAVEALPERTNSMAVSNKIAGLELGIAEAADREETRGRGLRTTNLKKGLASLRIDAHEMVAGVTTFSSDPALAVTAFSAIRAAELGRNALVRLGQFDASSQNDVKSTLASAIRTLTALASNSEAAKDSLPKLVAGAGQKAEEVAASIVKRWPEFSSALLPVSFSAKASAEASARSDALAICFSGEVVPHGISVTENWYERTTNNKSMEKTLTKNGRADTVVTSYSTPAVRLSTTRQSKPVHSSRFMYQLLPPSRDVASSVKVEETGWNGRGVVSAPDAKVLEGCRAYKAAGLTDAEEYSAFAEQLGFYNSWVAVEGWRSALLEMSSQQLVRATELLRVWRL